MANFHLEIVSMDGQKFDDEVERVSLRTITGDLAIMAHHINYCTAVGMGTAKVIMKDGSERKGSLYRRNAFHDGQPLSIDSHHL